MYSIHNRDDLEKLKKIARNKIFFESWKIKTTPREARLSL